MARRSLLTGVCLMLSCMPALADAAETTKAADVRPKIIRAPGSERVIRIENEHVVIEPTYEGGARVGTKVTLRSNNAVISCRSSNGMFSTDGMPLITRTYDLDGRVTAALADGREIATYSYSDGYVESVSTRSRGTLRFSRPSNGEVTEWHEWDVTGKKRVVNTSDLRREERSREMLRDTLLGFVEADVVAISQNRRRMDAAAAGELTIISEDRRPAMYIVNCGGADRLGFSVDGDPLFYDVWMNIAKRVPESGTNRHVDTPSFELAHVVPDRLLLSHTGSTWGYVSSCAADADCGYCSDFTPPGGGPKPSRVW